MKYAVKCLDIGLIDSMEGLRQLRNEIFIMCQLDHPNIVQVYEISETEGQRPYIAMQYIAGGSLKEISDLLAIPDKVRVMVDVADALHAAHQAGLEVLPTSYYCADHQYLACLIDGHTAVVAISHV